MFKFIAMTVLAAIGAGYITFGFASLLTLGFTAALITSVAVGLIVSVGIVIPTGKVVLSGLALNSLTGGTSGGYNRVS